MIVQQKIKNFDFIIKAEILKSPKLKNVKP